MISSRNISILRIGSSLFALWLTLPAAAELPRKAPITRYTGLWSNSPFTTKPLPQAAAVVVNELDDYTLSGIAPVPGGYRITIINRKDPSDKRVIEPGGDGEFSFVSITRDPGRALGTTVVLTNGRIKGSVTFEPELLALNLPPAQQQPSDSGKKQQNGKTNTQVQIPSNRTTPNKPSGKSSSSSGSNSGKRR